MQLARDLREGRDLLVGGDNHPRRSPKGKAKKSATRQVKCAHINLAFIEIPTVHSFEKRRMAWGCTDCDRFVGSDKGMIRWSPKVMCEEDASLWGYFF